MSPTGEDGVPSLALLEELADRVLEYAAEELTPARTTLEVTGYADGDYEIRAYETLEIRPDPDRDGEITERIEVRYNRQTEWIQLRRYRLAGGTLLAEDVRDLEAYADPVALAESDEE